MASSINGGNIKFGIQYSVDQSSLQKLQKSLQDIQNLSARELLDMGQAINVSDALKKLDQVKESASAVQVALQKSFSTELGTLNISKFNTELKKLDINKI
jgi:uncharacterized membrane protein (DUF106 family)